MNVTQMCVCVDVCHTKSITSTLSVIEDTSNGKVLCYNLVQPVETFIFSDFPIWAMLAEIIIVLMDSSPYSVNTKFNSRN